jgi:CheY-like chemotaxis protein/anti-sigma regulatory factor (Ser/Thr protein kinase)
MAALAPQAHNKGLELAYHIPSHAPDNLVGDAGRLRQALLNLVGNAVKFTSKGEVALQVSVEGVRDKSIRLHFAVRDTGIGIPSDQKNRIFKAFEQLDASTTRVYGGTGLGLAISAQLVQLMGGEIWVESEPGQGSVFHFTACFEQGTGLEVRDAQLKLVNLTGLKALITDDNLTNRRILKEMLQSWGMLPTTAEDWRASLEAAHELHKKGGRFDVALIDYMMPELARLLKNDPMLKMDGMIILTSGGRRADIHLGRESGICAFLQKPVRQSELLEAISRVVSLREVPAIENRVVTPDLNPNSSLQCGIGVRALLAEDNRVNQKLAVKMIEKLGPKVDVVSNGREAVDALRNCRYDLVFMDVQMPEMDGFEATRLIRELETPGGPRIPIIAMTAHAMKGDRERCIEAGMDAYISKPIRKEQLQEVLRAILKNADAEEAPPGLRLVNSPEEPANLSEIPAGESCAIRPRMVS